MNEEEQAVITASFDDWIDYPLVKTKFCAYNSGYVPGYVRTYWRDIRFFDEVHPDSLRIDGCLGSSQHIIFSEPPMVSGMPPDVKYDFRQADKLVDMMNAHNVDPYWCYSYVPKSLLQPGQDFRNPPSDLNDWAKVAAAIAGHFCQTGRPIAYHEIYNEPDNRYFFTGTLQDYLSMYDYAARAIRTVDPKAKIGGPALAFTESWVRPFLDYAVKNKLPLDFFSFHYYPCSYPRPCQSLVDMVRYELDRYPELATTEMHLNEYNVLPIDYPKDGPQQKHKLAAALLENFAYFISQPSLTKVHWAQFMDTGGGNWSGLISEDGHKKAAFNAYKIYSMMPIDRRRVSTDGPSGIGGMASSDDHKCGLVIWNTSNADQTVCLNLNALPFEKGTVRIYRIDSQHASWGDNPANEELVPVEVRKGVSMHDVKWTGNIPDGGVVYLEATDEKGVSCTDPSAIAEPRRILYYYPDRKTRAYADFDRNTSIARLGMAGEDTADARVGVVVDGLPDKLTVLMQVEGELRKLDANSLLGVRLDYEVDGIYTKSVLFHGPYNNKTDLYSSKRFASTPWGTKQQADKVVAVPNLAQFDIDMAEYAPSNWNGLVLVSFVLQNAGPDVRAKVVVR